MGIRHLFDRARKREQTPVQKIILTRAVYQAPGLEPRVDMVFEVDAGGVKEQVSLDIDLDQALLLIQGLTACYESSRPPIRPKLGGTWS